MYVVPTTKIAGDGFKFLYIYRTEILVSGLLSLKFSLMEALLDMQATPNYATRMYIVLKHA